MNRYEKLIKSFYRAIRGINEFESIPRDFGTGDLLYSSEIHTLQVIGNNANINLTEIAAELDISKSGVSKFINKLLQKNLITKSKQPRNNKEVVFNLTEKGLVAYVEHEAFDKRIINSIFDVLTQLGDDETAVIESFLTDVVLEIEKLNNKQ